MGYFDLGSSFQTRLTSPSIVHEMFSGDAHWKESRTSYTLRKIHTKQYLSQNDIYVALVICFGRNIFFTDLHIYISFREKIACEMKF
jgi:hypothetical protein